MGTRWTIFSILLIALIAALGCSGNSSPVLPGNDFNPGLNLTGASALNPDTQASKAIWGYYEIQINTETWEAEVIPVRGVEYTVDVVQFLQKPVGDPSNLQISVNDVVDWFSEGKIGVEVGLDHPFPGFDQYTGWDVMGVFITPGSLLGNYDPDLQFTAGGDQPILLNPDGYTRWMNPVEFPENGTILNFTTGKLGTPDIGLFNSTINAYKYFADKLDAIQDVGEFFASDPSNVTDRGAFRAGSLNHRQYDLQFPIVSEKPTLIFQYAVVASWVEPDSTLSGNPDILEVPGDFPYSANADEPIYMKINDESSLYYNGSEGGGNIKLDIEFFDWTFGITSGTITDVLNRIVIDSPTGLIPGNFVQFDSAYIEANAQPGTTSISSIVEFEIEGVTPLSNNDLPILFIAEPTSPTTFDVGTGIPSNDDNLAAYFRYDVPVGGENPTPLIVTNPNGGEIAYMTLDYDIEWTTLDPSITDVSIEWSSDDFNTDINVITASTPNTGMYTWSPVQKVRSDTAKIRVKNAAGSENDVSDEYFLIRPPVELDFQDVVSVDNSTVTFSYVTYLQFLDEFSPAISQDPDGMVHIVWHGMVTGQAREVSIRTLSGSAWTGEGGCFFTSGGSQPDIRKDCLKLTGASNNTSYALAQHWTIYFSVDVDHYPNGHSQYNYNYLQPRVYQNGEIIGDDAFLYLVGDGWAPGGDLPGIYSLRLPTPNYTWVGPVIQNTLTNSGEVSHSRSWAFQDDLLVMAYFTNSNQIKLLRQTDQGTDTWDDTEVIFDGTGYTQSSHPALSADSNGRLFCVWRGIENGSGDDHLLVSMLTDSSSSWTSPMVIATSNSDTFDDQHISAYNTTFELPDGSMQDLILIGYEVDDVVQYQIVMVDAWDWLPAIDVSDSSVVCRDPDTMAPQDNYGYDALFTWAYEVTPGPLGVGNYDIQLVNGNFVIPTS